MPVAVGTNIMDGYAVDTRRMIRAGLSRAERAVRRLGAAAVEHYPYLRKPVLLTWKQYMLAYGVCRGLTTTIRGNHRAAVDPFTVVDVDPDRVQFLVESDGYPNQIRRESVFSPPKFKHAGTVVGGDWDALDCRFDETELYRGVRGPVRTWRPVVRDGVLPDVCGIHRGRDTPLGMHYRGRVPAAL